MTGEAEGAGDGGMTPDGQAAPEYTYGKVQVRDRERQRDIKIER